MKKLIITFTLVTGLLFNLKAQQAINATVEKEVTSNKNKPAFNSILTKNEYGDATGGVIGIQNDAQKLSKKGYDSYNPDSDMASVGTNTNPYYVGNGLSGSLATNSIIGAGQISAITGGAVVGKNTNGKNDEGRNIEKTEGKLKASDNGILKLPAENKVETSGRPIAGIVVKGGKN